MNYGPPPPGAPPYVKTDQANVFGNFTQQMGDLQIARPTINFARLSIGGTATLDITGYIGLIYGGNGISATSTGILQSGNVGFHGHAAVAQGGAIASPTAQTAAYVQADVESLRTAIDALRATLTAHGITA